MVAVAATAQSAVDPWAVQSRVGLTDARIALNSMLMPISGMSYTDYRSGVMAHGDSGEGRTHMAMRVQPATAGTRVTVEMGNCVINTSGQGAYMCALDSRRTLTLSPASATTNRIDLIIARVYDDLNPAIASAPDERKFQIEVWEGDGATGTPTQPTPTPTEGWTPLAAVYVAKNTTAIAAADIVDLRGPGLVSRGGMRALYGDDAEPGSPAYAEPGAYPGDQRWVNGNAFQHQVYYGEGTDPETTGWRGVHNWKTYTVNPPRGETLWTKGAGTTREMCRVRIPYPGVPYAVYPTARCYVTLSPNTSVDFRITIGDQHGSQGTVNWMREHNWSNRDRVCVPNIAPIRFGETFYRDVDVYLSGSIRTVPGKDFGFAFRGNDTGQTILQVSMFPSVIQPAG